MIALTMQYIERLDWSGYICQIHYIHIPITKIRSSLKVRIQGSIENKTYLSIWVHYVFERFPSPKRAHCGPKKAKTDLKK